MEITFAWFWVIKSILTIVTLYVIYRAMVVHKLQSKFWDILAILLVVLSFINPIKINGTNSNTVLRQQNYSVAENKILPEKVRDTTFEDSLKADTKDITHKEIWK